MKINADALVILVCTMLALGGIATAIHVHNSPPLCPVNTDAKFAKGYWYCVPKGQVKWGPMGN